MEQRGGCCILYLVYHDMELSYPVYFVHSQGTLRTKTWPFHRMTRQQ